MKSILGISAYYHDSAACLVRDGEIVAAAQEERLDETHRVLLRFGQFSLAPGRLRDQRVQRRLHRAAEHELSRSVGSTGASRAVILFLSETPS